MTAWVPAVAACAVVPTWLSVRAVQSVRAYHRQQAVVLGYHRGGQAAPGPDLERLGVAFHACMRDLLVLVALCSALTFLLSVVQLVRP